MQFESSEEGMAASREFFKHVDEVYNKRKKSPDEKLMSTMNDEEKRCYLFAIRLCNMILRESIENKLF